MAQPEDGSQDLELIARRTTSSSTLSMVSQKQSIFHFSMRIGLTFANVGGGFVVDTGSNSQEILTHVVKEFNIQRDVQVSVFALDYRSLFSHGRARHKN
jgi:hypothetical protein